MKKLLYLTLIFLLTLALGGCKSDQGIDDSNDSTVFHDTINDKKKGHISIQSVSLDDEDYTVLKAGGAQYSMIFSIELDNSEVNEIKYWIDHYRDGEHVDSYLSIGSQILNTSRPSSYKLYLTTSSSNLGNEIWTLSLRENKNLDSSRTELVSSEYDSTIIHPINTASTNLNEAVDLGMIVRNQGVDQFGASNDVNSTIKENKEVYVLRCLFE